MRLPEEYSTLEDYTTDLVAFVNQYAFLFHRKPPIVDRRLDLYSRISQLVAIYLLELSI